MSEIKVVPCEENHCGGFNITVNGLIHRIDGCWCWPKEAEALEKAAELRRENTEKRQYAEDVAGSKRLVEKHQPTEQAAPPRPLPDEHEFVKTLCGCAEYCKICEQHESKHRAPAAIEQARPQPPTKSELDVLLDLALAKNERAIYDALLTARSVTELTEIAGLTPLEVSVYCGRLCEKGLIERLFRGTYLRRFIPFNEPAAASEPAPERTPPAVQIFERTRGHLKINPHVEKCPTFGKSNKYQQCDCCVCVGCNGRCTKWRDEEIAALAEIISRAVAVPEPAAQQEFPCDECGRGAGRGEHTKSCRQAEPAPTPSLDTESKLKNCAMLLRRIAISKKTDPEMAETIKGLLHRLDLKGSPLRAEASALGVKEGGK
jgi:hypothetical protein